MWNNNEIPFEDYVNRMLDDKVKHQRIGSLINNFVDTFKIQYLGDEYFISKRYSSLENNMVLFDERYLNKY
jgi:hypothetical protein